MREKSSYSFLRSVVKDQDHSFFKGLTGVFCTFGGTLIIVDAVIPEMFNCVIYEVKLEKSF
jgi:hypothetical protein